MRCANLIYHCASDTLVMRSSHGSPPKSADLGSVHHSDELRVDLANYRPGLRVSIRTSRPDSFSGCSRTAATLCLATSRVACGTARSGVLEVRRDFTPAYKIGQHYQAPNERSHGAHAYPGSTSACMRLLTLKSSDSPLVKPVCGPRPNLTLPPSIYQGWLIRL